MKVFEKESDIFVEYIDGFIRFISRKRRYSYDKIKLLMNQLQRFY